MGVLLPSTVIPDIYSPSQRRSFGTSFCRRGYHPDPGATNLHGRLYHTLTGIHGGDARVR